MENNKILYNIRQFILNRYSIEFNSTEMFPYHLNYFFKNKLFVIKFIFDDIRINIININTGGILVKYEIFESDLNTIYNTIDLLINKYLKSELRIRKIKKII